MSRLECQPLNVDWTPRDNIPRQTGMAKERDHYQAATKVHMIGSQSTRSRVCSRVIDTLCPRMRSVMEGKMRFET